MANLFGESRNKIVSLLVYASVASCAMQSDIVGPGVYDLDPGTMPVVPGGDTSAISFALSLKEDGTYQMIGLPGNGTWKIEGSQLTLYEETSKSPLERIAHGFKNVNEVPKPIVLRAVNAREITLQFWSVRPEMRKVLKFKKRKS